MRRLSRARPARSCAPRSGCRAAAVEVPSRCRASERMVGCSNSLTSGSGLPSASTSCPWTAASSRECPPRSKKLSSTPTRSTLSTSRQISASRASRALAGCDQPVRGGSPVGRRQRPLVDLAAAVQRQHGEVHEGRGQHVCGEIAGKVGAEFVRRGRTAGVRGHHVGGQEVAPDLRVGAHQHMGVAHSRVAAERGGDLTQLYAEAADLDLAVLATDEVEIAVRQAADAVAAGIEAGAWLGGEGVGEEALRRQVRAAQIPPGDACSTQQQFAPGAERPSAASKGPGCGRRCRQWASRSPAGPPRDPGARPRRRSRWLCSRWGRTR